MRKLRGFVVIVVLLALAGAAVRYELERPVRRASDPPQKLSIPQGAGVGEIGRRLADIGLVRDPLEFKALVVLRGSASRLRAGEYVFEGTLTLDQVVEKLAHGETQRTDVTFPEGKNIEDMAAIAAAHDIPAAAFRTAAADVTLIADLDPAATDLEGYLFPDTYEIPKGDERAHALVQRMVKRFRDVIAGEKAGLQERGITLRQAVTLASIVELETASAPERPRVAAVFLNRLKAGMPLQTDPTVIFALRRAGTWDGNIRKADLDVASPYNTYKYAGLPPGPIASPGRASIHAVLAPAPTRDVYFVSRNDGTHHFSENLATHSRAVDYYQRHRGQPPPPDVMRAPVGGPPRGPFALAGGGAPAPPPTLVAAVPSAGPPLGGPPAPPSPAAAPDVVGPPFAGHPDPLGAGRLSPLPSPQPSPSPGH